MGIYIIFCAVALVSYLIQRGLKSRIEEYSKIEIPYGLTGKDVAEKMLHDHGITDVKVQSTGGFLTDHYNPETKIINLSEDIYYGNNVSAAAVAAHETGHAVQHATAYSFLKLRSALVPPVSFASRWVQWILLAGVLLIQVFPFLLLAGIVLFALTTLFSFVTLPVEINASARALNWLESANICTGEAQTKAKKALSMAAYTYVIAALSSLATLAYYVLIYLKRR
ncbi:MAG: zinc metallopeptidase [Paludibacteraceae bacterium]|nr:zinc metallopeptidase [Candidatus Physcocola equi]MCQ2233985.1 zinc metallopeptidase [Paludibacteraceae bacterium]